MRIFILVAGAAFVSGLIVYVLPNLRKRFSAKKIGQFLLWLAITVLGFTGTLLLLGGLS